MLSLTNEPVLHLFCFISYTTFVGALISDNYIQMKSWVIGNQLHTVQLDSLVNYCVDHENTKTYEILHLIIDYRRLRISSICNLVDNILNRIEDIDYYIILYSTVLPNFPLSILNIITKYAVKDNYTKDEIKLINKIEDCYSRSLPIIYKEKLQQFYEDFLF